MPSQLLGALVDPGDRRVASDREILERTRQDLFVDGLHVDSSLLGLVPARTVASW
jgi:hypothetical protein